MQFGSIDAFISHVDAQTSENLTAVNRVDIHFAGSDLDFDIDKFNAFVAALQKWQNLTQIFLSSADFAEGPQINVASIFCCAIIKNCHNLEELGLNEPMIADFEMPQYTAIADALPSARCLKTFWGLGYAYEITHENIPVLYNLIAAAIPAALPELRENFALDLLANHFKINTERKHVESDLEVISVIFWIFSQITSREELALCSVNLTALDARLWQQFLELLARHSSLTTLNLAHTGFYDLTRVRKLQLAGVLNSLPSLRALNMYVDADYSDKWHRTNIDGLQEFFGQCSKIEAIHAGGALTHLMLAPAVRVNFLQAVFAAPNMKELMLEPEDLLTMPAAALRQTFARADILRIISFDAPPYEALLAMQNEPPFGMQGFAVRISAWLNVLTGPVILKFRAGRTENREIDTSLYNAIERHLAENIRANNYGRFIVSINPEGFIFVYPENIQKYFVPTDRFVRRLNANPTQPPIVPVEVALRALSFLPVNEVGLLTAAMQNLSTAASQRSEAHPATSSSSSSSSSNGARSSSPKPATKLMRPC